MKRKVLAQVIVFVMLFSCFSAFHPMRISASGNITVSMEVIRELIPKLEQKFASIPAEDRSRLYQIGRVYLETDMGIDTIISAISDTSVVFPDELSPFIQFIRENSAYQDQCVLALLFVKSIPESARKTAIQKFTNREAYGPLDADQKAALDEICEDFLGSSFLSVLKTDHNITPEVLLNLASCLRGTFKLTDPSYGSADFALSTINSSIFAQRLFQNVLSKYSSINSYSIVSANSIINAVIAEVNQSFSSDLKAAYKTVAGSLGMYVSFPRPGSGGGGGTPTPKPTSTPTATPTPTPTTTPTPTPTPTATPGPTPEPIPEPTMTEEAQQAVSPYTDMDTHWSKPFVAQLLQRNIFKGYPDHTFMPDSSLTREQAAVLLVRVSGLEGELPSNADTTFNDAGDISDWAQQSIALLVQKGILRGYGDGTFQPKNAVSRQELAAMTAGFLSGGAQTGDLQFGDKDTIPQWAYEAIQKLSGQRVIEGYEDNTFRPTGQVTRAEAATMIYKFMYVEGLLEE